MRGFIAEESNYSNLEKWADDLFARLELSGAFQPGQRQPTGAVIEVTPIEDRS